MFASTRAALKTFGLGRAKSPPHIDTGTGTSVAERQPAISETPAFACYVCDSQMVLVEAKDIPEFGVKDLSRHTMRCETCGMMADRIYHHMVGYDRGLVL